MHVAKAAARDLWQGHLRDQRIPNPIVFMQWATRGENASNILEWILANGHPGSWVSVDWYWKILVSGLWRVGLSFKSWSSRSGTIGDRVVAFKCSKDDYIEEVSPIYWIALFQLLKLPLICQELLGYSWRIISFNPPMSLLDDLLRPPVSLALSTSYPDPVRMCNEFQWTLSSLESVFIFKKSRASGYQLETRQFQIIY